MNDPDQVALVTGGNRGLGLETCRQLAQKGFQVILTSRSLQNAELAAKLLESENLSVIVHALDVSDPKSVSQAAAWVRDKWGQLDVLINNAGVFLDPKPWTPEASVLVAKAETFQKTYAINLMGPLFMMQSFVPLMSEGARIVNVSSGAGQLSDMQGGYPAYRSSKSALNALTRTFAQELREKGITVNSVCPGWVRTDMGGPNAVRSPQEGIDTIVWLATEFDSNRTAKFFRDRKEIPW